MKRSETKEKIIDGRRKKTKNEGGVETGIRKKERKEE
jgi:hypothetical protein